MTAANFTQVIDHLQKAKAMLESQRDDAKKRYDKHEEKFRKRRNSGSAKMRNAWYEYVGVKDMLEAIGTALERAAEVKTAMAQQEAKANESVA